MPRRKQPAAADESHLLSVSVFPSIYTKEFATAQREHAFCEAFIGTASLFAAHCRDTTVKTDGKKASSLWPDIIKVSRFLARRPRVGSLRTIIPTMLTTSVSTVAFTAPVSPLFPRLAASMLLVPTTQRRRPDPCSRHSRSPGVGIVGQARTPVKAVLASTTCYSMASYADDDAAHSRPRPAAGKLERYLAARSWLDPIALGTGADL